MTHYSRSNGVLSSILDRSLLPSPQAYYGQYFTLKGSKPFVICPFHHEKTASFQIYLDTGRFFCHGCGEHGDMIAYHMKKHGYTFNETVKDLGANIAPIANETTEAKAARIARQAEAERQYQERKQQADNEVLAEAQAFIPTVKDILKHHANSLSIPPYIEAKGVIMDNLQAIEASVLKKYKDEATGKVLGYGMTGVLAVIPLHTMQGELVALQVINGEPDEKGKYSRRFIGKPSTLKAFFFIGNFTAPDVVLICEGVADALSLFEATGYPVLCALSASRLTEAAQAARNAYPQAKIILCADNDSNGQGQQAALTAAQAVNGYLALPQSPHKDFNDIHRLEGLEQVNAIIQESTAATNKEETAKNTQTDPDLINKKIESLPTPEERNTARALQSALACIESGDFIGDSAITSSKIIGYGLSHEYKQAQGSIGALLAIDWDNKTGGNSFYYYRVADLKHDRPIKVASIYKLAQSKGWVMPADQDNTIETHRNAPRGNAAMLYGIFGEFGRAAAKNTEVNQYAAAMNLMIYLSASVGRGIYFYIGNDVHHVRLYGLHIGRSSRGQKGGAHSLLNRVIRVITESDDLQLLLPSRHTGGLSSKEGLAALIHDGYMQGKEEVAPITDKRLFIRESEFSNVMHQAARNGNTLSAGLRDAWDGVGIQPATKLKGTWASHPHIAIAGACTPVELLALTTKNDVSNGFLNRFIIFWAERTKLIPFPDSTPIDTVNLLATKIKAIIQFAKGNYVWDKNPSLASEDNRQITLSDDAKRTYGTLYINVFPKYNDGDKVAALTERKAPYLLRMAALFAISDFSLVIEEWHINAAYEWVKYWHESVKFIFNDAAEEVKNNEISDHASKIVSYLASKDKGYQATRTELSKTVFSGHLDSKALDEALNTLITSTPQKIEVIEGHRSDGATGKKPKFYILCELSELSELTTAARVTPFANNCEVLRTINDKCEITQNDPQDEKLTSLNSQLFADVRINANPTAATNFAKFANFAEIKIENNSEEYEDGGID